MARDAFHADAYGGSGPQNYERYFVPAIGAPLAADLVAAAAVRAGERVLDVACGTGVVSRLAADRVGPEGSVAGLDMNPGMLAVARAATTTGSPIDWHESGAEAMPFPDDSFDVVLCQMGLQFFADKHQALEEMRRVLAPGGRVALNLPGPRPGLFAVLAEALARHVDPRCEGFVNVVFSLHEGDQLRQLTTDAGFDSVDVEATRKTLRLPDPESFLWQYTHSTPLAGPVGAATREQRSGLVADVTRRWQDSVVDGTLTLDVRVTTVLGR